MRIAKATVKDACAIRALERKVWGHVASSKYEIPVFIRFGHVFVAKEGRKVIGAIMALNTTDDRIYVDDWFVDKAYRGRGIGRKLYQRLFQAARDKSIVSVIGVDYKESLEAHRRMGFKEIGKSGDFYGFHDKLPRILVEKVA